MLLTHTATHFSSAPTPLGQRAPVETYSPCRSEIQAPLHGVEVTAFFNYFIALAYIILEGWHCCSSSVQAGQAAVYKTVQLLPFFSSSVHAPQLWGDCFLQPAQDQSYCCWLCWTNPCPETLERWPNATFSFR